MTLIIDDMDQNTTIVPIFQTNGKDIESQFVNIYLCGVLVYDIGLYYHIWVDSDHKHDSN